MITSVKQEVDTFVRTEHTPMTLSGMAVAVVAPAPVAASTPHRGSASNSPSIYLGRQRGEESLIERTHFVHAFFVLNQEGYAFRFMNVQNSSTWGRNYKIRPLARSFDGKLLHLSTSFT